MHVGRLVKGTAPVKVVHLSECALAAPRPERLHLPHVAEGAAPQPLLAERTHEERGRLNPRLRPHARGGTSPDQERVVVTHLTSVHPPKDARIYHKECRSLAAAGFQVLLIAPSEQEWAEDGVALVKVRLRRLRWRRMVLSPLEILRKTLQTKSRIVHLHDPELIPLGVLLKLLGRHVIYDAHENLPRQVLSKHWIPHRLRPSVSVLASVVESTAALAFDGIVAATESIARRFPRHKTVVVRNFPRLNECPELSTPLASRPLRLAYTGGLTCGQGIREMIAAMERLPQDMAVTLSLAGEFKPPDLANEVRRMQGWKRVEFLGVQSRENVFRLLLSSFAGIVVDHPLPNYVDGLSTKMFEYMLAGLPVIVSDFPQWRRIVTEVRCGIVVDPLNPDDIAQAILWLVRNPEEAQAMGSRGREAVRSLYNWDKEVGALLSLYDRIAETAVGRKRRPRR